MAKKKKVKSSMDYVPPARYKKPVQELLTIYDSGFGSKKVAVQRISAEEIKLPDGTVLYTGVPAQPEHFKLMGTGPNFKEKLSTILPFYNYTTWRILSMNYAFAGQPFTFHPQSMKIITNEKKRAILVDQGVCIPVHISSEKTVYVAMYKEGEKAGEPVFKDEIPNDLKTKLENKKGKEKLKVFYEWIDSNRNKIKNLETHELPVKTEFDVTEMEMVRAEWSQIIYGNAMKKYAKVQDQISDRDEKTTWYFIIMAAALCLVVFMFLFFANQSQGGTPV